MKNINKQLDPEQKNLLNFFKLLWNIKKRLDQERKNN